MDLTMVCSYYFVCVSTWGFINKSFLIVIPGFLLACLTRIQGGEPEPEWIQRSAYLLNFRSLMFVSTFLV